MTLNIVPKIDRRYNRVELFFPNEIHWSNTAIPYLRIACWCEAEGHDECCLEAMNSEYRPGSTYSDELIIEAVIKHYCDLYLSSGDRVVIRKRVSSRDQPCRIESDQPHLRRAHIARLAVVKTNNFCSLINARFYRKEV